LLTAAAGVATQAGAGMLDDDLDTYFASKGAGTCDATSCRKAAPLSLSLCSLGPSAGAALWMDGRQRGSQRRGLLWRAAEAEKAAAAPEAAAEAVAVEAEPVAAA
jgi:hypothetical protein